METFTTIDNWASNLRADIQVAESSWRHLDHSELSSRGSNIATQHGLAKQEMEIEVSWMRAHLAVAAFLQGVQSGTRADEPNALTVRVETDADPYEIASRLGFAMLLQRDDAADAETSSGVETRWGLVTSEGNATSGEWWITLEASTTLRERLLSTYRFRFKVVGDRVEGWLGLVETNVKTTLKEDPSDSLMSTVLRPVRSLAGGFDRLVNAQRSA